MERSLSIIKDSEFLSLFKYIENKDWFSPHARKWCLYKKVMNYKNEEKFSDKFIELVYVTLKAWGMHRPPKGPKLSDYNVFRNSILKEENKKRIQCLQGYTLKGLGTICEITDDIKYLFNNLNLVADGKPKLVTYSKALHFFAPKLLMPIDRRFTLRFFGGSFPAGKHEQIDRYCEIFEEFHRFAAKHKDLEQRFTDAFFLNTSIPKIIDNIIMAYVLKHMPKKGQNHN